MAGFGKKDLLSNASPGNGTPVYWPGGLAMFIVCANFGGGGNVKLQVQAADGSTWVDVTSSTLSANGTLSVNLPQCSVRAVLATATACYASLHHIPGT